MTTRFVVLVVAAALAASGLASPHSETPLLEGLLELLKKKTNDVAVENNLSRVKKGANGDLVDQQVAGELGQSADVKEDSLDVLLRGLLDALDKRALEKRGMQAMRYDPSAQELTIYFQVCVIGDRGVKPCRKGSTGHYWEIEEYGRTGRLESLRVGRVPKYMVIDGTGGKGPVETIKADFDPNMRYVVRACELTERPDGKTGLTRCNTAVYKGPNRPFLPKTDKKYPEMFDKAQGNPNAIPRGLDEGSRSASNNVKVNTPLKTRFGGVQDS